MTVDDIPDLVLERYRLNELPAVDAARVAAELGRRQELRERLAALEQSDDELREQIESLQPRLVAQAASGHRHARARRRAVIWAIPAMAVMAGVVLALVVRTEAPVRPIASDDRVKGTRGPVLALYRRTADGSERLADGASARAGDLIRLGYHAAGRRYGMIVSIDGGGTVTMHLPVAGDHAVALEDGATVLLSQAYELDEAPRWERFYFVAGDAAFEIAPVVQAAREAARTRAGVPAAGLALPRGLEQITFTLQKESRP